VVTAGQFAPAGCAEEGQRLGAGGQCAAQGVALDPVGYGDAVAVGVGQRGDGGRAPGADRAVQRRHSAAVRLADGRSRRDQQVNDAALRGRVPGGRQRPGVAGVVQGRRAAAVDRVDGGTGGDQGPGGVVPETGRGQVQGRVAPAGLIRDGSFARTASKMGSMPSSCPRGLSGDRLASPLNSRLVMAEIDYIGRRPSAD
jgi:hypothetical protein